ncbi:MAG: PqqD family protein [Erysipelotrichaceae bacterium]|nr:PqqD family protein [Erysipelotrichaceae bacterium]
MKEDKYIVNSEFILREIAGENILVPTGKAAEELYGIVSINNTGKFLLEALKEEQTLDELKDLLKNQYELEDQQSLQDVKDFLEVALSRRIVLRKS